MPPTSTRPQLLARLAQRAQWRILSRQSRTLSARPWCQQKSTLRQLPAPFPTTTHSSRGLSLSSRSLQQQRAPGTTSETQSAHSSESSTTSPSQPQPQPQPPRRRPRWVSATILLLVGAGLGTALRAVISPPPPLIPGSDVDAALTHDIRLAASRLPVVQALLSSPEWSPRHHEAYASIPEASRPLRITTGPLGGTRGVGGYQHVFHNTGTGEVVAVVYFGPGTVGWPGVVHGGMIATILDEHSARAASPSLNAGKEDGSALLTARLDITYKRPTLSSDFYVVRARALAEEELPPAEKGKRDRKAWVDATVETVEGKVCVESRALFVAPRGLGLRMIGTDF